MSKTMDAKTCFSPHHFNFFFFLHSRSTGRDFRAAKGGEFDPFLFFFHLVFIFFYCTSSIFLGKEIKCGDIFFVVLNRIRKKWKCTPCWSAQHPPASLAPYTHTGKQQLVNQFYPANPEPIKWKVSSLYRYRSIQRVFPLQSLARAYKRLSARARVLASAHDWSAMRNAARNGGGYYTPGHIHACITLKVYPSPLPFLSPPSPPPP